jgi:hypothetical protein
VKPKRTLGIGLAVATALITTACAAGQIAQTAYERNTQNGTDADIGQIHIRGMVIDAPTVMYKKGDSAEVKLVLVNTSQTKSDLLDSISSPAITTWGTFNTTAEANSVLAAHTGKHKTSLPAPDRQVLIPAAGRTSYGTPDSTGALVFLNFTHAVYPGTTIPVTMHFAQAGTIKIFVPIALSPSINTSPIAPPSPFEG